MSARPAARARALSVFAAREARVLLLALALCCAAATARARPQFPPLTEDGLPNVQSDSCIVVDLDTGKTVFEKNTDHVRAIASTSKIFVALTVRRLGIDLDGETEITEEDARLARGGARSRLYTGNRFRNIDLLRAMLIASDNRAASALGRAVGLSPAALIYEMNQLAASLGLSHTTFTDCSGLHGNVSTVGDMAVAFARALGDPVLAEIMQTEAVEIVSLGDHPRRISYRNTNRSLRSDHYDVIGGKTGYTDAAGYCLAIGVKHQSHRLAMVFLGAHGKLTRFGDFSRVMQWLGGAPGVLASATEPEPAPETDSAAAVSTRE